MLDFSDIQIEDVVIHWVGNKGRDEGIYTSRSVTSVQAEEVKALLATYLLEPFAKTRVMSRFVHTSDLRFNEVYNYVSQIFARPDSLLEQSINLVRHLYECSTHPRIKGGEFYMVYLKGVKLDGEIGNAVGIYRTENKETYLKVVEREEGYGVEADRGINIHALDKGCLVLDTEREDGYRLFTVDAHGRSANEARYWREDFLSVDFVPDEGTMTGQVLDMLTGFLKEGVPTQDAIKPAELRANTVQFFEQNDQFETARFESEVLKEPDTIESFRAYRGEYEAASQMEAPPSAFPISKESVKAAKRRMRSVIKLDSSFTIYLRNVQSEVLEKIERGEDAGKGLNYYKFYFKDES
ncbi:nucleoid-associated protein [Alicyclobacillus fastidiosus]|uniref:Nucleoid-associated protein n=1 Tax=Alicyclobacillus fastidiosus TaxID=392011 RepID=A0ABV5AJT9_9BACL|nr:nucleoid-associated protein [Alicyclobacillus fastidiosus]WEH08022.1 nucleoid-associated protein [Alicyclobacillus fastidiosus]